MRDIERIKKMSQWYADEQAQNANDAHMVRWNKAITMMEIICDSPIEVLLGSFLIGGCAGYQRLDFRVPWDPSHYSLSGTIGGPQVQIGPYRTDFLFEIWVPGKSRFLAVECDGYEFHERTKQQAERDKKRDRWFLSQNIPVMRFTGSEIWRDGHGPATDIRNQLNLMYEQMVPDDLWFVENAQHKTDGAK